MLHRNVENFIGCDSSYRTASIVLYGAPFDSTTCLLYTSDAADEL